MRAQPDVAPRRRVPPAVRGAAAASLPPRTRVGDRRRCGVKTTRHIDGMPAQGLRFIFTKG